MTKHRNWLVFANRNKCHHAEALHHLGFVNWRACHSRMKEGDVVYLYMSDERRVRFKTQVVAKDCRREDMAYWQGTPDNDLTFKLEFRAEYNGNELNDDILCQHGFNGGRSIERPMYNNAVLFQYIEEVFAKASK